MGKFVIRASGFLYTQKVAVLLTQKNYSGYNNLRQASRKDVKE
jgi:hypothetical protein